MPLSGHATPTHPLSIAQQHAPRTFSAPDTLQDRHATSAHPAVPDPTPRCVRPHSRQPLRAWYPSPHSPRGVSEPGSRAVAAWPCAWNPSPHSPRGVSEPGSRAAAAWPCAWNPSPHSPRGVSEPGSRAVAAWPCVWSRTSPAHTPLGSLKIPVAAGWAGKCHMSKESSTGGARTSCSVCSAFLKAGSSLLTCSFMKGSRKCSNTKAAPYAHTSVSNTRFWPLKPVWTTKAIAVLMCCTVPTDTRWGLKARDLGGRHGVRPRPCRARAVHGQTFVWGSASHSRNTSFNS